MSKLSFMDKLRILFEVSQTSKLYLVALIILIFLGIVLFTTNRRNEKRNKLILLISTILIIFILVVSYHSSLGKMYTYMMENFFIVLYFPNIAIYLAGLIATTIILWISIFNYKTSKLIKGLNIIIYIVMNYLLALLLNIINQNKLDIFTQSSIYQNKQAAALIELSSIIFFVWILFLVIYKVILIYLKKEYKPPVKKVLIKKKVKKLPENYVPKSIPSEIHGTAPRQKIEIIEREVPVEKIKVIEKPVEKIRIVEKPIEKIKIIEKPIEKTPSYDKLLTAEFEKMLTLEDYKLLSKMLKEEKKRKAEEARRKKQEADERKKYEELLRLYNTH